MSQDDFTYLKSLYVDLQQLFKLHPELKKEFEEIDRLRWIITKFGGYHTNGPSTGK